MALHNAWVTQSKGMSKAERRAAIAAWRRVPRRDRVQVAKLAKQGLPHPDVDVTAAASRWANMIDRRRLPAFVLPTIGVVEGVWFYFLLPSGTVPSAIITAGSCLVVVIGLLAWNNRHIAKLVLAIPTAAVSSHQPVLTVELGEGLSEGSQGRFREGGTNPNLNR